MFILPVGLKLAERFSKFSMVLYMPLQHTDAILSGQTVISANP